MNYVSLNNPTSMGYLRPTLVRLARQATIAMAYVQQTYLTSASVNVRCRRRPRVTAVGRKRLFESVVIAPGKRTIEALDRREGNRRNICSIALTWVSVETKLSVVSTETK